MDKGNMIKRIFALGAVLAACLIIADFFHVQNPWSFNGWYRCADSEGYPDSTSEMYLVIGDSGYAVVQKDDDVFKTVQTGNLKKDDNKDTRASEYVLTTNDWDSAELVYHRIVGNIIMNAFTSDGGYFNMTFVKAGTSPNMELPEIQ